MYPYLKYENLALLLHFPLLYKMYSLLNSLGQNTGVGILSLLQGIFPTQESNLGLLCCRQILYLLSHKGSPRIREWVAYPFSIRFSLPRIKLGSPALQVVFYQLSYHVLLCEHFHLLIICQISKSQFMLQSAVFKDDYFLKTLPILKSTKCLYFSILNAAAAAAAKLLQLCPTLSNPMDWAPLKNSPLFHLNFHDFYWLKIFSHYSGIFVL